MSTFERKLKLTWKLAQLPTCRAQTSRNSSPWGASCHRWKAGYLCITI